MKLIRYSDLIVAPWKNGLGIRRDLARGCYQDDNFDTNWLVSIADVNESTQLSTCPGISRWFMPITKGWVTLTVDLDGISIPVELTEDSPAHRFTGDATVHCLLRDGPMKTLNIGVEGKNSVVEISKIPIQAATQITLPSNENGKFSFLTVINGNCKVKGDSWSGSVAIWNSLMNESGQSESFEISPTEATELVIATIKLKTNEPTLARAME
jgi:environmental stress-induced protein Ves